MLRSVVALACVACALAVALAAPDSAWACRDYDGHRNSVVAPTSCGSEDVGAIGSAGSVDAAIDAVGLPPIFHTIAARESGDDPYAVNPYSGACGPFQFLPSTAASLGYSCADLTDPYTAAEAALALYNRDGLSPWAATAY
jgi:hypothetical protein